MNRRISDVKTRTVSEAELIPHGGFNIEETGVLPGLPPFLFPIVGGGGKRRTRGHPVKHTLRYKYREFDVGHKKHVSPFEPIKKSKQKKGLKPVIKIKL